MSLTTIGSSLVLKPEKNTESCFVNSNIFYFYSAEVIKMNVSHIIPLSSKSIRKAIALLGVYALHLIFFQALMQATPAHNVDNTFKPLFTHHQKKQNPQPPNHPAVTYYTMLIKQGKDVGRVCTVTAPAVNETEKVSSYSFSEVTTVFHLFGTGFCRFHVGDAAFKLYRLIQVFLI